MESSNFIGLQFGEQFIVQTLDRLQSGSVSSKSFWCDFQEMLAPIVWVAGSLKTAFLLQAVRQVHHLSSVNAQGVGNGLLALRLIVDKMQCSPFAGAKSTRGLHVSLSRVSGFVTGAAKQVRGERAELRRNLWLVFHRSTVCQGT